VRLSTRLGLPILWAVSAVLYAQDETQYFGRYEDAQQVVQDMRPTDQFVFARLVYNGVEPYYIKNWYTDWPKADRQLIAGIQRLSNLDIADQERVVALNDPRLFEYPFLYTSEPGQIVLTDADAMILREYLDRGGLWVVDDFWGSFEWGNFTRQVEKVLPGQEILDIPRDHPVFHCFYDIDQIVQVPSLDYIYTGVVVEQDGFEPYLKGIWDSDTGRLLVVINHNTDLGDAYEHADHPQYPHRFSGFAYRMAMNFIIYALTS
jgi:Domain of unknown function (DUF4159)